MSLPTRGEIYEQLLAHLRLAQENCATMAHLHNTEDAHNDRLLARGWLVVSQNLRDMQRVITAMAAGKLQ